MGRLKTISHPQAGGAGLGDPPRAGTIAPWAARLHTQGPVLALQQRQAIAMDQFRLVAVAQNRGDVLTGVADDAARLVRRVV